MDPWVWVCCGYPLQWHHNGLDSISNHQPHDCLLKGLFRCLSKKTSKLRITGLCAGNSPHKLPVTRTIFPFDAKFYQYRDSLYKNKMGSQPSYLHNPYILKQLCLYQKGVISMSLLQFDVCPLLNTLRPRQNGCHFTDDISKCILLDENVWISIKISMKFVPMGPINSIPALVQIMAWCRPGDKPLSEPMMLRLLTHICVTRPQWVKWSLSFLYKFTPV